jgi:Aspartyl protease
LSHHGHRGRIISLLAVVAAFALTPTRSNAKFPVRFRTVNGYLVVVPVHINGRGPFDFLVDTGTNTTLFEVELAAELKLEPVGRELLTTLTGSETVPRYALDSVSLGIQTVSHLAALGQGMKELHALEPRIRGVLGLDFLLGFAFVLDYGHQEIELCDPSEAPDLATGTRVPIQVVRARILVSAATESSVDGSWNLALDSGIAKIAVFESRLKDSQRSLRAADRTIRIATNLSNLSASVASVRYLAIGNLRLRDLPVVVLPTNPGLQRGIEDGLLPTALFRYILVNAKQSYMVFVSEQRLNP